MTLIEQVRRELSLSEKRMRHTDGVVRAAKMLAERHFPSLSAEETELAALLHDFTKEYPREAHLTLCEQYGISLSETELLSPKLLHARTGAAIADRVYRAPEAVCLAVRWHTTGRPDMTPLEAVLYLADYIEENRTFPSCVKLREHYEADYATRGGQYALQKTLLRSFKYTVRDLLQEKEPIDPHTVAAWNFYLTALRNDEERKASK